MCYSGVSLINKGIAMTYESNVQPLTESEMQKLNWNVNTATRSYTGSVGCMCGCKGKYTESTDNKSGVVRAFNRIKSHPNAKIDRVAKCIFYETETRNNVVFFG